MGQPGVLTITFAAPSAAALAVNVGGFGAGEGGGFYGIIKGVRIGVYDGHLKLNERNSGIRYTIYKYKIISLNKMNYNQKFIGECEELYKKIKENKSIQECLNNAATAAAATDNSVIDIYEPLWFDIYEPLWFVYYMFFAIHNPKMEDYIQKKSASAVGKKRNPVDIVKNLLKRRNYTSTIVFELYTHAYTNEGNVTYIYPKYKNNIAAQMIKSFQDNHLKTTAVLLKRQWGVGAAATVTAAVSEFAEYIITTQPTIIQPAVQPAPSVQPAMPHHSNEVPAVGGRIPPVVGRIPPLNKLIHDINYKRKDLIFLALVCYMKVDEDDINKKNIFISATDEEVNDATAPT